jgi:predicted small secreted protein
MRKLTFQVLTAMVLLAPLAACNEGPAERAGRSIDNAGSAIRDAVDPPRGPVERMGRSIDRAVR